MKLGINGRFYGANTTGVQRFAREVTARLTRLTDVTLLLPRGVRPPADLRVSKVRHGLLRGHVWEQLELPRLARAAGCDVTLHLSGTAPGAGPGNVVVIHDVLPLAHPEWFSRGFARWYGRVLPRAAKAAAAILTVSESSRREIVRLLPAACPVVVVTQGLAPFDRPAEADEVERVLERLDINPPYLLALQHGDARKNHAFLLRVLEALRSRGQAYRLVLAGESSPRVHGEMTAVTGPGVRHIGRVSDDELRALYTGAVALCFPSLAEGFGRPPFEAAACGTPALVADTDGVAEPAREAGLPLPFIAEAWAEAIHACDHDPVRRAELVARGRAAARALDWDACARQVLDVCETVAHGRARVTGRRAPRPEPSPAPVTPS